ncbi:MAG: hypothetical protein ACRD1H_04595, partial [Vicinamibacterales bacterium]
SLDAHGRLPADNDCRIVCERHEDWCAVQADDAELVSAKHREPSYGAYTTMTQLVDDGGLGHLFTRWNELDEKPTCRLVTTAGLGSGPPQRLDDAAAALRGRRAAGQKLTIHGDHEAAIDRFAKALMRRGKGLPADWTSLSNSDQTPMLEQLKQAGRFLAMLSIEPGKPNHAVIAHAAPSMYAKPILDRLGQPTPPEAVWEAVIGLFRTRMRAAGPLPTGALPAVLAFRPGSPLPGYSEMERQLAGRIVSLTDIDIAIQTAIANPRGYLPLRPLIRSSRVAIKMARGRCADNSIERAEQLRLDYQKYWRTRRNNEPAARADQERLRRLLLRVSDVATNAAARPEGLSGEELWQELQNRLHAIPHGQRPAGMDLDLLLGGICALSNRCQVWFSDRFDIQIEIARMRRQRGVTQSRAPARVSISRWSAATSPIIRLASSCLSKPSREHRDTAESSTD